ncbi:protein PML-like isoform X2 [Scyliorhinus canicula]|uniref:protein PML-like isoform X2 n=1 Tax=Scyliorhinus canicula TaxID=7830 RepID=UPI0018F2E822|nr:protein PML-like isoform X2 [Scyliorhinus canicula]
MAETASEESPLSEKLECGVCNKQLARPKLLPCLHSICQDCLQKEWASQSSSTCPVCSAPTNGDITNLQDNEFVANVLSKLQLRGRIGVELDIRCSLCQVCGDDRSATSLCFECDRFLCIRCCHSHQLLMERYGHFVKTLDDLKMINSEDFVTLARNGKQTICPNHKEQHIRFFCKTCSMSICCNCLLLYHNSPEHCYHDIKQEVVLKKEELKQMVDAIQENHNKFTETYTQLKFLEESLNIVKHNTEALIRQKASSTIQEINKQGDALLKMLETGCHSEGINLTTSLKQTEQIIIRMGAGKELAEKMLKFGTNEEMIEMYNTIKSALTALVAEMPVDVSKEGILINFTECTLETRNLLGDLVTKKEQSKEAGDCEDDEILLDTERSSGEASANLEIFPAGNELPGAPVDGSNEDEFEDMVSPSSYYPGPSDRAPFPRVMEQPEWAGEEEDRSEQPLSPHPGFSAWTRDRYPNGPSIQCESVQKHKKVPKKLGDRRPWPVEDTNTNVKRKYQHSEHNYSTTLTTESHADVTLLNITEIKHEESWRLPTEERNDIVQLSAVSGEKIFNKYIMPSIPMMEAAAAITGIQVMDGILYLRGEPQPTCSLQEAMAAFLQFLQSLDRPLLAGHNIWIRDCQILYKAWGDLFMKDQFVRCISGFLDTLWLSRNIVPRSMVKNYKLKHLVTVCVGEVFLDGTLSDVRALQELYWVLSPTPGHIQRSWFSFSQLECRVTLQPLFDQHMISRLVADQLAFKEVSLTILQLAHHNDSQSGLRDLFSTLDNLGLTNPQVAIESIRSYLEILSSKKTLRRCHRHVSHTLKVENELNNG